MTSNYEYEVSSPEAREEYARQARARIAALPPEERAWLENDRKRFEEECRKRREYADWLASFPDFARPW